MMVRGAVQQQSSTLLLTSSRAYHPIHRCCAIRRVHTDVYAIMHVESSGQHSCITAPGITWHAVRGCACG
jgi:hypothetical protein